MFSVQFSSPPARFRPYGWLAGLSVVCRGHALANPAHETDFPKVTHEHGDPAEGGHSPLGLPQNQPLAGEQSSDFPRNRIVRNV